MIFRSSRCASSPVQKQFAVMASISDFHIQSKPGSHTRIVQVPADIPSARLRSTTRREGRGPAEIQQLSAVFTLQNLKAPASHRDRRHRNGFISSLTSSRLSRMLKNRFFIFISNLSPFIRGCYGRRSTIINNAKNRRICQGILTPSESDGYPSRM